MKINHQCVKQSNKADFGHRYLAFTLLFKEVFSYFYLISISSDHSVNYSFSKFRTSKLYSQISWRFGTQHSNYINQNTLFYKTHRSNPYRISGASRKSLCNLEMIQRTETKGNDQEKFAPVDEQYHEPWTRGWSSEKIIKCLPANLRKSNTYLVEKWKNEGRARDLVPSWELSQSIRSTCASLEIAWKLSAFIGLYRPFILLTWKK